MWDKIDLLIRFLLIIVSLVFMILCIINQDHKLFSAIICVGGTTCLWIKKLINAIQLSIISVVFCHREPLFFMPKNFKNITKNS